MSQFPPYESAKAVALELNMKSRNVYIAWHKKTNCKFLPRYPNRVYKEFTSWNDWLGTRNEFIPKRTKNCRTWWEAVKWSQKYAADNDLNTMQDWLEHVKKDGVVMPDDIPKRPDIHYDDWTGNGWPVWLGKNVRSKLKAARVNTHIFAICSYWSLSVPKNMYAFVHAKDGVAEMKQKIDSVKDLVVYRAYYWDDEMAEQVNLLFKQYARDEGDGKMFVPDLNSLLFELDSILDWWKASDK